MRSNSNVIMYSFCVFNFCLGSFLCDLKNPATLQRDVRAASLYSFLNHLGKQNQPYKGLFGYSYPMWIGWDWKKLWKILTCLGLKPIQSHPIHMDWEQNEQALTSVTVPSSTDTTLCPTQYLFNTNFLELLNILNRSSS